MIPEIAAGYGRGWSQPDRSEITVEHVNATMPAETFDKLADYSFSRPTGLYPGKMWKEQHGRKWLLRWVTAADDLQCVDIHWAFIVVGNGYGGLREVVETHLL